MTSRLKLSTNNFQRLIPSVEPNLLWRRNPNGSVAVVNLTYPENYFTISGLAAAVFLNFDGKRNLYEIYKIAAKNDQISLKKYLKEISEFIRILQKKKAIKCDIDKNATKASAIALNLKKKVKKRHTSKNVKGRK